MGNRLVCPPGIVLWTAPAAPIGLSAVVVGRNVVPSSWLRRPAA